VMIATLGKQLLYGGVRKLSVYRRMAGRVMSRRGSGRKWSCPDVLFRNSPLRDREVDETSRSGQQVYGTLSPCA
jgi:hypothetical protein